MPLPLSPPYPPMEARRVEKIPSGEGWQYEPKWDGFRVLIFREGDDVYLQSKSGQPLARYFPEIVESVKKLKDPAFVADGEIVIVKDGRLSFDDLQLRLHPAESRVKKLAAEIPAQVVLFDLLAFTERKRLHDLRSEPLHVRREKLESWFERHTSPGFALSPASSERDEAVRWQDALGGLGLDGVMAKRIDLPYRSGERTAMQKIKRFRDADCVIGGVRFRTGTSEVAVILLGLYGDEGLQHVGNVSSMSAALRAEVTERVAPLVGRGGFDSGTMGGPSRWSNMKESRTTEPEPVEPSLVVEVSYDYFNQGRFRHGARFVRWRDDKDPESCTMDQVLLDEGDPAVMRKMLGGQRLKG